MKAARLIPCLILSLFLLPCATATSLENLNKDPRSWDGLTVTVTGEVVGKLEKGRYFWVNLWENGWALGIWCTREQGEKIRVVGDYHHVGDRIEVTGVFHAACEEHGGVPDLHAENLLVVSGGYRVFRSVNLFLLALSLAVLAAGLSLALFLRFRSKKPSLGYSPESF